MPITGDVSYHVAASVLINGISWPWYDWAVDVNNYAMASTIEARISNYPLDGKKTNVFDLGSMTQLQRDVPIAINLSYGSVSGNRPSAVGAPNATQFLSIEQGLLDEYTTDYLANQTDVKGRSLASVFQDQRSADSIPKNTTGYALAAYFFKKAGVPLVYGGPPKFSVGKPNADAQYMKSTRLFSAWDYMNDAALEDGYILTLHNGVGYYGPPAPDTNPTIVLDWGRDLLECSVNHAPRRSHKVSVLGYYSNRKTKSRGVVTYGHATGSGAETIRVVLGYQRDRATAQLAVQKFFNDFTSKEFISTIKLVPDPALISIVSQYGANFKVALGGVHESAALLYHVKHVRLECTAAQDGSDASLLMSMVMENHAPVAGGGAYS